MARKKINRKTAAGRESGGPTGRNLPRISHLQFLTLHILASESQAMPASLLNKEIARFSPEYGGPKFYQLMKRLTEGGLVETTSRTLEVSGAPVTRTFYSLASDGRKAMDETLAFYVERSTCPGG
jgi:hypothetical protein